jgi:diamine N-acetyltransferase
MDKIEFVSVKPENIKEVQKMAGDIWNAYYRSIILQEQIDYMLKKMYDPAVIEDEISKGVHWEFIAYNNQKTGFISYHYQSTDKKVKLSKIYLYPEYHGKGLGQAALKHVIAEAEKYEALEVFLTVNKQNIQALKAYHKAGFIQSHSAVFDIGNGFVMDDYVMVYKVIKSLE